jgi:pyruvate kinase
VIGIVAGTRTTSGSTNFMRLHVIGSGDDGPTAKALNAKIRAEQRILKAKKKRATKQLLKRSSS